MKWKIALGLFVTIALVAGGVLYALESRYVADRLKEALASSLSEALGAEVGIEDIEIDALSCQLHLTRLQMSIPGHAPFFTLAEAKVYVQPIQLLSGTLEIERVILRRPVVSLEMVDEAFNLPSVPQTSEEESPLPIVVQRVEIEEGAFKLSLPGVLFIEAEGLNVEAQRGLDEALALRLSARSGAVDLPRAHERIDKLAVEGIYSEKGFTLSQLDLVTSSLSSHVEGQVGNSQETKGEGHVSFPMELLGRALGISEVKGSTTASFHFEGRLPSLGGQGAVRLDSVAFGPYRLGSPSFRLRLSGNQLEILEAEFPVGAGRYTITGAITLTEDLPARLTFQAEKIPFAELLENVAVPGSWVVVEGEATGTLEGRLSGEFLLEGDVKAKGKNFIVLPHSFRQAVWDAPYLSVPEVSTETHVKLFADRIEFSEGQGGRGATRFSYSGVIFYDGRVDLRSQGAVDLRDLGPIDGIVYLGKGTFTDGRVANTLWDPHLSGNLHLSDVSIEGYPLGEVRGTISYRWPLLSFPAIEGKYKETSYLARAFHIDTQYDHYPIEAEVEVLSGRLGDLSEMLLLTEYLPAEVESAVKLKASVKGPIEEPDIKASVRLDQLSLWGERLRGGDLELDYKLYGDLVLRQAILEEGNRRIYASGSVSPEGDFQFSLASGLLRSSDLNLVSLRDYGLSTEYSFHIDASGNLSSPQARGTVILEGTTLGPFALLPSRLDLTLEDGRLVLSGDLFRGDLSAESKRSVSQDLLPVGSLAGEIFGEVNLSEDLPFSLGVRFDELSLAQFLPEQQNLSAEARSELFLSGDLLHPEGITGEFRLSGFSASYQGERFWATKPLSLSLENNTLYLSPASFYALEGALGLNVAGVYPLGGEPSLDLAAALDLNAIAARLPEVVEFVSGTASARGTLTLGRHGPRFLGSAQLEDVSLSIEGVPHPIEELDVSLSLTERSLLVDQLRGSFAGGEISGGGEIELSDFWPARFQIEASVTGTEIRLPEEGVSASLDASFALSGPLSALLLEGDIDVNRLKYDKDVEILPSLGDLVSGRNRPAPPREKKGPQEASSFEVDLEIRADGPIRVENNLLQAELTVDSSVRPFRVYGSPWDPAISGSVVLVRNDQDPPKLALRGIDFVLTRSVLDFDGPLDPALDVVAETRVRDFEITLRVTGTALAPEILLSSSPPLPEEDIILLLTLGITQREFEANQILSIAPEILTQFTGVDKEVERILPKNVDVNFTTGFSEVQNTVVPKLQLKWEPFERLRIRGSTNVLSLTEENQLEFQLLLKDHLSLSGVWEQRGNLSLQGLSVGDIGLDLKRRWEF